MLTKSFLVQPVSHYTANLLQPETLLQVYRKCSISSASDSTVKVKETGG